MTDQGPHRRAFVKSLTAGAICAASQLPNFSAAAFAQGQSSDGDWLRPTYPKQLPVFGLPPILPNVPGFSSNDLRRGVPRVLNFFGSWCQPCIAEHPQLMRLSRAGVILAGIAVRDNSRDLQKFIGERGNPFVQIGTDPNGRFSQLLDVSRFPTTLLVDGRGFVRFRIDGDLDASDVPEVFRAVAGLY